MNRRESLKAIGGTIACGLLGALGSVASNEIVLGGCFTGKSISHFVTNLFSQEVVFLGNGKTQTVFKIKVTYTGEGKLTTPNAWKDCLALRLIEGPFEKSYISVDHTGRFLEASFTQFPRG